MQKENLYIITDFDHTLTTKDSQNCWGCISEITKIDKEYIKKSKENSEYYLPIEQNENIDYKEKSKYMQTWYQKHMELLIKYKLKEKDLKIISQSHTFKLRKGVKEFLKYTNENNIPVIIISAGISSVIENVLEKNNCLYKNVYIISNIFQFKNGIVKGFKNKIIHPLNKNQIKIPLKISKILKGKKTNFILGDNMADTLVKIKKNDKILKIGILNYKKKNKTFKKHFDIILKKDFLPLVIFIKKIP